MTLERTIKINKKIMRLILSKYEDSSSLESQTPESRYYQCLRRETEQAENYLATPATT